MILLKNHRNKLSTHLSAREFQCRCDFDECRHIEVREDLIEYFEILRGRLSTPLTINSGHRCARHNFDVGGVALSKHLIGAAIDIKCPENMSFSQFKIECDKVFPFTLGYPKLNFVHCDVIKR